MTLKWLQPLPSFHENFIHSPEDVPVLGQVWAGKIRILLRLLQGRLLLSERMRRRLLLQGRWLRRRHLLLQFLPHMNSRAVILVVEDDIHLRTTMAAVLTLRGFFPLVADSVHAALKLLGTARIDAIVLDVRLPDQTGVHQSGLNLLRFVRATPEYAQIPVVVFTGLPLSDVEQEIARANDAHVLFKPQPYSVLCDHLNGVLKGAASR